MQSADLPQSQANSLNSVSYPQWEGKFVLAHGLRGEGLMWLIGIAVSLCA